MRKTLIALLGLAGCTPEVIDITSLSDIVEAKKLIDIDHTMVEQIAYLSERGFGCNGMHESAVDDANYLYELFQVYYNEGRIVKTRDPEDFDGDGRCGVGEKDGIKYIVVREDQLTGNVLLTNCLIHETAHDDSCYPNHSDEMLEYLERYNNEIIPEYLDSFDENNETNQENPWQDFARKIVRYKDMPYLIDDFYTIANLFRSSAMDVDPNNYDTKISWVNAILDRSFTNSCVVIPCEPYGFQEYKFYKALANSGYYEYYLENGKLE